jgi:hypothetical protein
MNSAAERGDAGRLSRVGERSRLLPCGLAALAVLLALITWYVLSPRLTEAERPLVGKWFHFLSQKAPDDTLVVYDFQPDRSLIIHGLVVELNAATGGYIERELHGRWRVVSGELVFRFPTERGSSVTRALGLRTRALGQAWEDTSPRRVTVEGDVLTITSTSVRSTTSTKLRLRRYDKP